MLSKHSIFLPVVHLLISYKNHQFDSYGEAIYSIHIIL